MLLSLLNRELVPHPLSLLVLNRAVEIEFKLCCGQTEGYGSTRSAMMFYCDQFVTLWKQLPIAGNTQIRKKVFGRPVPLPLIIMLENRKLPANTLLKDYNIDDQQRVPWRNPGTFFFLLRDK